MSFLALILGLAPLWARAADPKPEKPASPAAAKDDRKPADPAPQKPKLDPKAGSTAEEKPQPVFLTEEEGVVGAFTAMWDKWSKPEAAADPSAPPSPAKEKVKKIVEGIAKDMETAPKPEQKKAIIQERLGAAAAVLVSPESEDIPAPARNGMSNDVAGLLNQTGELDTAKKVSDSVLGRDPDNKDALNNRAMSHFKLGSYPSAIADADHAALLDPTDGRALTTRAMAHYQMKNYAQALEDARRALAIDPNNMLSFQIARLSEGRVSRPSSLALDAAQKAQADKIAKEYEGMLDQRSQAETSAPVRTEDLRAQAPSAPAERVTDSLNQKALVQVRLGDAKSAIEFAGKALAQDPRNARAYYIRAAAQNMMGEHLKAIEDAGAALERNPALAEALDARAAALNALGRHDEAILDAERSMSANEKNPYAYRNRGLARESKGDIDGMIEDYRSAALLNPQFEVPYKEAVAKYRPTRAPARAPESVPPPARGNRRFLVVLASSLTGGFLVAVGLLHILGGRGAKASGTQTRHEAGDMVANYRVVRTIGNGGMGVVYEAFDKALGRPVAIKKLRDELKNDPVERERFLQEARIVAALHHPNIVDIHTILQTGEDHYLVFEFVKGRTLEEILAQKGRLSLAEAQFMVRGACAALAYAHDHGVVHRDLKPSNVMLTDDGWVKVMDFGIARQAKDGLSRHTAAGTGPGTPVYMAPEQERGEVRKESDVYALGVCLYEMLTGKRAFHGSNATAAKLGRGYPKPTSLVAGLPPAVDALIDAALDPDPDRRIPSAVELRARLDAVRA